NILCDRTSPMLRDPDHALVVNHDPNWITQGDRWSNFLESIGGRVKPSNLSRDLRNPQVRGPTLNCNFHWSGVRGGCIEPRHPQSVGVDLAKIASSRVRKPNAPCGLLS